jgi:hypothetical protein
MARVLTLRFDMRAPSFAAPTADLYRPPLCGGLPPAQAWPYLERAAEAVARASASG